MEKCEKAMRSTAGNNMACEAVWGTWTDIITYAIGFAVYLIFLAQLEIWIILLVSVTAAACYFINRRAGLWEYNHRQ